MAARVFGFPATTPAPRWRLTMAPADAPDAYDPAWAAADDHALVRICLAGHRAAFDLIVERHRRHIYQVCYRFAGNHEDASDLAQEAFIRAYRSLAGFKGQSAFGTWLHRIAVNLCLNHVSAKSPVVEAIDPSLHVDGRIEPPDAGMDRARRAAELRAAIARLPKTQRATIVLRIYHELPHQDIASILGSSVGAVKANLFHAIANLRKLIAARGTR
jgi:RNA polymerase sigma-70 factor (ECF subfamily)